jgi:hypothetical protein
MVDQVIQDTFLEVYRDDFRDSAGFHRILFNSGRALQAREVTQLQTIIQREITRFGDNIFKEGAIVHSGGFTATKSVFAKLNESVNLLPTNTATLIGTKFTGSTSGVSAIISYVEKSTVTDPGTIYFIYESAGVSNNQFIAGENITNGTVTLTIQTTNTSINPAFGKGLFLTNNDGVYYVTGRFVFSPKQSVLISKYSESISDDFGFLIEESIVTANDDVSLYDNSGAFPNTTAPGADRYKISLTLTLRSLVDSGQNFVYVGKIKDGVLSDIKKPAQEENYNVIQDMLAVRTSEESGDYLVKPFILNFSDNADDNGLLDITIQPGIAYVDGYRVATNSAQSLTVVKPRSTTTINNEVSAFTLGNYVVVNGLGTNTQGLPNIQNFTLVNLRSAINHGGSTIGTARVRAVDEDNSGNYRMYLFDIIMNSGQNFRSVRSIGTSSIDYMNLVLELGQAVLKEPKSNTLLVPLPKSRPQNLTDISLATQRRFTASVTTGSASLTLSASGETFANVNDWIISADDSDVYSSATISGAGTSSATISGLGAASNIEVLTYVNKANGSVRAKTLNANQTDTIAVVDWDSDGEGIVYADLTKPDIYNFTSVTRDTVSGNSVRSRFTLDNGQRDNFYGLGRITLKPGQSKPTYPVVVKYDYFSHGVSGDFFAVNSYSGQVAYKDIPNHTLSDGTVVPLRDVLDFRPVVNSSGTFGAGAIINELPQPFDTIQSDISYYNSSFNKLIAETNGRIRYIAGTPSLDPKFPPSPDNSLDLYRIFLNPYTLDYKDLDTKQIEHKHYTMKDIGRLENRVAALEEVTSLSLLELDTAAFDVLDSDGNNRTKSGFFVDNFSDHTFSATTDPDYKAAIDPTNKFMRPQGYVEGLNLMFDSADYLTQNVVKRGDNIYLNYTHRTFINQNQASATENVTPYWGMRFEGHVTLSPSSDNWTERRYIPDRVTNTTVLDTSGSALWGAHNWNWGGVALDDLQVGSATNTITLGSTSSTTTNTTNIAGIGFGGTQTTQTTNTSTTTGQNTIVGSSTISTVTNDRLLQIAAIPFMRSIKVYFQGKGFRPNTKVFAFFDGIDVTDWCKSEPFDRTSNNPTSFGNIHNSALGHPEGSSDLISDINGTVEGSFFIPATSNLRFTTGTKTLLLIDITDPVNTDNATTYGRQNFTSAGVLQTRQRDVLNTRTLEVASGTSTISTSSTVITDTTINPPPPPPPPDPDPDPGPTIVPNNDDDRGRDPPDPPGERGVDWDPLAQSFTVNERNGVFLTKVDYYFATKDPGNAPVWAQLRQMDNGYPSAEVIPGSTVFKYPGDIITSTDASVATTFEFEEPVYLAPGKEYCVVIISLVPTYSVYISRVGDFVLGTTDAKIVKQPFLGSFFKSQNNTTWTAVQWEDLKIHIYAAQFEVNSGSVLLTNTAVPKVLLNEDPLSVDSGDNTITVYQPNHGYTTGDTVTLSGAVDFAGISAGSINGSRLITAVDPMSFRFDADSSSNSAELGGGDVILSDQNIMMDIANINLSVLTPTGTSVKSSIVTTTGQSFAGTETAYQLPTSYRSIELGKDIIFDAPQIVANQYNEDTYLSGKKSFRLNLNLNTTDENVSPVIDMQRALLIAISNVIDNPAAAPATGYNVPFAYVPETNAKGGSAIAKHISKVINLAEDAVGLKIFVAANKPSLASFSVYYRVSSGDENISDVSWTLVSPESTLISDNNPNVFRDYSYLVGGNTGTMNAFNSMQLKIVMTSESNSKVPVFKDIRAIALSV